MTTQQPVQDQNQDEVKATEPYTEEIGTIVFQSALMQYLAEEDEEQSARFEAYIEAHIEEEDFLESLCANYPKFEEFLKQEIMIMQEELKEVTSAE